MWRNLTLFVRKFSAAEVERFRWSWKVKLWMLNCPVFIIYAKTSFSVDPLSSKVAIYRNSLILNIKHKVKTEAAPAVFFRKYQKPANPYPTNFSKWNYIKTGSQLTHSFPMHPFSTPFWCFQWAEKRCIGNEWVKQIKIQNTC